MGWLQGPAKGPQTTLSYGLAHQPLITTHCCFSFSLLLRKYKLCLPCGSCPPGKARELPGPSIPSYPFGPPPPPHLAHLPVDIASKQAIIAVISRLVYLFPIYWALYFFLRYLRNFLLSRPRHPLLSWNRAPLRKWRWPGSPLKKEAVSPSVYI